VNSDKLQIHKKKHRARFEIVLKDFKESRRNVNTTTVITMIMMMTLGLYEVDAVL
jgi:hypothetical protein